MFKVFTQALAASLVLQVISVGSVSAATSTGSVSAGTLTATDTMNVRIEIVGECKIVSTTNLDFGKKGVIDTAVDGTSEVGIQCTNGTPYTVGLSAGNGTGATTAVRKLTGPASATVDYSLYRDAARKQVWGTNSGTDTVARVGNGDAQMLTVYGQIPVQPAPGPGIYSDVVAVTVQY